MGCTSSAVEEPIIRVIALDYNQIINYIDELPYIVLQKLSEKFNSYCSKSSQVSLDQFKLMYNYSMLTLPGEDGTKMDKNEDTFHKQKQKGQGQKTGVFDVRTQILLIRLYYFYTDMGKSKLKFKHFISKYSILTKSSQQILSNVIYFINVATQSKQSATSNIQTDPIMTGEQYNRFILQQKRYFGFKPEPMASEAQIMKSQFYSKLRESGFYFQEYRNKFTLFDKRDFPFEEIGRQLVEMEINDYVTGSEYYIISAKWFEQWSFYYQGAADFMSSSSFKSTKLLRNKDKKSARKKRNSSVVYRNSSRDLQLQTNSLLITFEDIQGQYSGQLKQNIRPNYQIKTISLSIWQLLKKTLPAENQFKRYSNSPTTIDLYPKHIYYLETDKKGKIIDESFQIIRASIKTKLEQLHSLSIEQSKKRTIDSETKNGQIAYSYFIKQFGEDKWYEENGERPLGRCSTQLRFFVVQTSNKSNFLQYYTRKEKTVKNLTYGDITSAYFSFTHKAMPAYIIRLPAQKTFRVHFQNYSFRYEIDVKDTEIHPQQHFPSSLSESLRRSVDMFTYKGIRNIGNTCFINSIIQCLIATPIFQEYIIVQKFDQKKQPLLHQVSQVAKSLLNNEKVSPYDLKKTIDMQLQIFSGNDQHDAQQFLGFLLDKFSKEIQGPIKRKDSIEPENIIENLFGGKTNIIIKCSECGNQNKKSEDLSILSLPIPQPQYNNYTIYIFPISNRKIRKIVFRLHHTATFSHYLNCFEERTGQKASDYIFAENNAWARKKARPDFEDSQMLSSKMQDMGITPSIHVFAYERFSSQSLNKIYDQNQYNHSQSEYFDYYDSEDNKWVYGKYPDIKTKKKIEVMDTEHPHTLATVKLETPLTNKQIAPLGMKTKLMSLNKIYSRKYNTILQKMQLFGQSIMISYPRAITYDQLKRLLSKGLQNYCKTSIHQQKPYHLRIAQSNKQKCIFCGNTQLAYQNQKIKNCCKPTDKERSTPIIWLTKDSNYIIYLQWKKISEYDGEFASTVQIDPLSLATQKQKEQDKIEVQDCLNLLQKPEKVEMLCDKCQHTHQSRKQIIQQAPNILILHMKEFRVLPSHTFIKLDVNLKWVEHLDISSFTQNSKGSIYELYAYVRHTGTSNSGHYTSVARRKHLFEKKKVWVNFDDDVAEIVETEQKNIDSAYLLFFKKVDMPSSAFINFTKFQGLEKINQK